MSIRNPIVIDDDSTDEEMVSSPTSTAPRVDMALDTSIEEEDEEGEVEQVVQDTLAERMALEAECFSLISRITAIERAQDDSKLFVIYLTAHS